MIDITQNDEFKKLASQLKAKMNSGGIAYTPEFANPETPANNTGEQYIASENKLFEDNGGWLKNAPTDTLKEREVKSLEKKIYDLENDPNNYTETPALGVRGSRVPVFDRVNKHSETIRVLKDALEKAKEETKGEFVGEDDRALAAQTSFNSPEEEARAAKIREELANQDRTFYTKNGHLNDLWGGLKKLDVLDVATLGWGSTIETISRAKKMKLISDKTKRGELLTPEEESFAEAFNELQKQEYYQQLSGGVGIANSVGEVLTEAPVFLGQMALTGGVGRLATAGVKAGAKGLAAKIGKEFAEEGTKKALKDMTIKEASVRGAQLLAENAIGTAAMTPLQNLAYKNFAEREMAQYSVVETGDGGLSFELTNPESALSRAYKSFTTAYLEIYSEGLGDVAAKGVKYLGARRLGSKVAEKEAARFIMGKSDAKVGFAKVLEDYKAKAKYDGFFYELAEEEFNMLAQPLLTGEESQFTNPSEQIKMALSVAAMSTSFKMVELPSYAATTYGKRTASKAANASLASIKDETLRNTVASAMQTESVESREAALDAIPWEGTSLEDRKFALQYMKHKTEHEVLSGAVDSAEHQDQLEAFDAIAQRISTPDGRAVMVVDSEGNNYFSVGGEYKGMKKDGNGNSSFDFATNDLVVLDTQGNYKTIPASSVASVNEYQSDNLKEQMFTEWQRLRAVEKESQKVEEQTSEVSAMNGGVDLTNPSAKPQVVVGKGDIVKHEDGRYRIAEEDAGTFTMLPVDEEGMDVEDAAPVFVSKAEIQRKMEQQAAVMQAAAEESNTGEVSQEDIDMAMAEEAEGETAFIDNGAPDPKGQVEQPTQPTNFEIEVGVDHLTLSPSADNEFKADKIFRKSDLKKAEKLRDQLNEDYEDKGITFDIRPNASQTDNPFEPTTYSIFAQLPVRESEPVATASETPGNSLEQSGLPVDETPVGEVDVNSTSPEVVQNTEEIATEEVPEVVAEEAPVADAEFIASEYPEAFALLSRYATEEGGELSPDNIRNTLLTAYATRTVTAEQLEQLRQLEAVNTLVLGSPATNFTTKADMLQEIASHEGFSQEQKALLSNMVEALATDQMPLLQDSSQSSKDNFYRFADNLLSLNDSHAFSHEIGHWGFFNVLSGEERLQFMESMKPKGRRKNPDLASSLVFGKPIRSGGRKLSTNAATNVQEYFAEQFMQYVNGANTKGQTKALFEKMKHYFNQIVALFSIKGYNATLQPYFDKIVDKNYLATLNYQLAVNSQDMELPKAQAELEAKGMSDAAELLSEPAQDTDPDTDPDPSSPTPPSPRRKPVVAGDVGALFSQAEEQPVNITDKLLVDPANLSADMSQMRFQDRMLPAKRLVDIMKEEGVMNDALNFYLAENRSQSAAKAEIEKYDRTYFKPILNFINNLTAEYGVESKEVSDYLLAKHSLERHLDENSANALSTEEDSDWNEATVTEIIENFEQRMNSYDPLIIQNLWKRVNAATSYALEASMGSRITKKQLDEYLNRYKFYVPLRGWSFSEGEVDPMEFFQYDLNGRFEGGRKSVSALTQAKGRITKPADPLAYISTITNQAIAMKHNAKVMSSFLNAVRANRHLKEYVQLTKLWTVDLGLGSPYETAEAPNDLLAIQKKALAVYRLNKQRYNLLKRIAKRDESIARWEEKNGKPFTKKVLSNLTKELDTKLSEIDKEASDLTHELHQTLYNDYTAGSQEFSTAYQVVERGYEGVSSVTVDGSVKGNRKVGEQYNKAHEVEVYDNGVRYVVRVSDPRLAEALLGTQDQTLFGWRPQDSIIGKTSRHLASVFTSKNPAFIPVNHVRDLIQATITLAGDANNDRKVGRMLKNIPKSYSAISRNLDTKDNPLSSEELKGYDLAIKADRDYLKGKYGNRYYDTLYAIFKENGGETGYVHFKDVKELQKDIENEMAIIQGVVTEKLKDKALRKLGDNMLARATERQATITENATRFATFIMSMENGDSIVQSIDLAKNISVNFNRKGTKSSAMGALYLFFNAGIQGNWQIYSNIKNNKSRYLTALGGLAAASLMTTAAAMFMSADDDEASSAWDRLPDYEKANNMVLYVGGGKFIKVPLPQGYRTIHNMTVQTLEVLTGKKAAKDALASVIGQFIGDTSPIDIGELDALRALTPTVLTPLVDIAKNETFSGSKVFKEPFTQTGKKYTPESQLGLNNVLPIFQWMSSALNWIGGGNANRPAGFDEKTGEYNEWLNRLDINPSVLEHLAFYYLGGVGTVAKDAAKTVMSIVDKDKEFSANTLPMLRRFVSSSSEDLNYYLLYQKKAEPYQNFRHFFEDNIKRRDLDGIMKQRENPQRLVNASKVKIYDDKLNYINKQIIKADEAGMKEAKSNLIKKRKEMLKKFYNSLEHNRDL